MSYCYFHGIVPVSEGRRVQTVRANGTTVWHAIYDSMFVTESAEADINGVFRTFAPASESNIPSDKLVLVHGKLAIPSLANKDSPIEFVIESINHHVFNTNPEDEDFDSFLPENTIPVLCMLGNVTGPVVDMGDGSRAVDVRVSSYVQNKVIESTFRHVFNRVYIIALFTIMMIL